VYLQEETRPRKRKYQYNRLNWKEHVEQLEHSDPLHFQWRYHMSLNTFEKLVNLLQSDIEPNEKKSRNSTSGNEPVSSELVVAARLRYLGGASYDDIVDIVGVSRRHTVTIV
jgi:hypothetical protein